MGYDLILVGGTGAQFGHATFESVAMGLVAPPQNTFIVDADAAYYTSTLEPLHKTSVETWFEAQAGANAGEGQVQPKLKLVPPYAHMKPEFNVGDLIGEKLSRLAELSLTQEEATWSLKEGLFGMAKVGGVAVGLDRTKRNPEDQQFPSRLIHELRSSNSQAPIVIAGSVAGGTGAGFMLPLVQAIREDSPSNTLARRPVYVIMFLPWFDLPPNDKPVGPSNQRMRRNASQGVRFAKHIVDLPHIRNGQAPTTVFVLGMPPGSKMPPRSGAQSSQPGSLLYYGVSILSGNFASAEEAARTFGDARRSGIMATRCHKAVAGKPAFQDQLRFTLSIPGAANMELPFDLADRLLLAQAHALKTLANPHRYTEAFKTFGFDDPGGLPRSIFNAFKEGLKDTASRRKAGADLVKVCETAAAKATERSKQLRERLASEGRTVESDPNDAAYIVVSDWMQSKLENVDFLNEVLVTTPDFERKLKGLLGEQRHGQAFALITRALGDGLARHRSLMEKLRTKAVVRGDACALPLDLPATGSGPYVPIDSQIDQLATELVKGDLPDSQCVPSPLAKAQVIDFYLNRTERLDGALASTPAGRTVLVWLGLSSGRWRIADRIQLSTANGAFERAIDDQESKHSAFRDRWIHTVATADGTIVAMTSPRVGFAYGVRVDETRTSPQLPLFEALESELVADGTMEQLRKIYRHFVDGVAAAFPGVRTGGPKAGPLPWFRALELWTSSVNEAVARAEAPKLGYHGVGPIPLQTSTGDDGKPEITYVTFPRYMPASSRERAAALLASICAMQAPLLSHVTDSGTVEIRVTNPATRTETSLLRLRSFGTNGQLAPAEDLRAGALDLLDFHAQGPLGAPMLATEWAQAMPLLRARLAAEQRTPRPSLSVVSTLKLLRSTPQSESIFTALGLGEIQLEALNQTPGLTAPALVNLFRDLSWP
jgi:hypothetical protein